MENENLKVYNAVRECPQEALKTISAGQAYHICEKRYGKAICKACRDKAVQKEQRKGTKEQEDLI